MHVRILTHMRSQFVGYLALFIALGGTSYAALKLPAGSVTSREVKNRSLLAVDFKRGQLPRGAQGRVGPVGPAGPQGPPGDPANFDSSQYFTKTDSDARFLGKPAKAADADKLDGFDSAAFGRVAYASVNMDGTLRFGAKGIASSSRGGTGRYTVRLATAASASCLPFATLRSGVTPMGFISASGPAVDGTYLDVRIQNAAGTSIDRPFHVLLVC